MNPAVQAVEAKARKALLAQLIVGVVSSMGFMLYAGSWHGISALAGAAVSITLLLVLRYGVKRAAEAAPHDEKRSMLILYLGAAQRFILILVLFALGLGVVALDPLAMFVGFFLAQLSNLTNVRG